MIVVMIMMIMMALMMMMTMKMMMIVMTLKMVMMMITLTLPHSSAVQTARKVDKPDLFLLLPS